MNLAPRNLALFDFDGTITCNNSFSDFVHFATPPRRLALGKVVLAPLIAAYKLGLIPGSALRRAVAWVAFRGMAEAQARALGRKFGDEVLAQVIQPVALERIQWHKAQGDTVVVVSASLDVYLAQWCEQHALELICTELEVEAGALSGRYRGGDCCGEEKSRRVLQRYDLSQFPVVYAYGDTRDDLAMLRLAHRKYFRWQETDLSCEHEINARTAPDPPRANVTRRMG